MTEIQLYNTRTRTKAPFQRLDRKSVRMYVCGPTVYDRAHIGNARPVVVFDVLYRLLRHVYGEKSVTYARNFTDVDDRIIDRAVKTKGADETLEEATRRITNETIAWYHEDMDALGALRPDVEPRCTEMIPQMVEMTRTLIDKGHAYEAQGHVLFAVDTYANYGALARRSLDDMVAGSRVEVAPYKKDPMDFVLWKPSTDEQPGWPSPWGRGRPGWHIECSAMAGTLFGPVFDIHGGGIDLQFPHHENEVAQSCCANGTDLMANVWMHNGFLQVEGEKMAKSLGNFFTVKDLRDRGVPGEVIRFVLLSTQYRQPLDWTEDKVAEAKATLRKWAAVADDEGLSEPDEDFLGALSDDLNTPEAIACLHEMYSKDNRKGLMASSALLGFDVNRIAQSDWARPFEYEIEDGEFLAEGIDYRPTVGVIGWGVISDNTRKAALDLVHSWLRLRREKDWVNADALRDAAQTIGIELRATRSSNGVNGGIANLDRELEPLEIKGLVQ